LSSNTNIGNTPVNQGYVQLIHTGETGGIDGTLRTLYDGDGTASDLQIASNKVKISTQLYIGSKTITEYVQDVVGDMLDTNGSHTNITATYDDAGDGAIDLVATGAISGITGGTGIDATGSGNITIAIDSTVATLTGTQTLSNKTLASPTFSGDILFNDASTPVFTVKDTTNNVQADWRATDTLSAIGTTTDNAFYLKQNGAFQVTINSNQIILNTQGEDRNTIIKDSSGTAVFKVDAGTSTTEIGTLSVTGNATVTGDFQVNGTTTTVNQTNLDVSDNIIGLNRGASSNANDSGLIIERGSTGNNVFIGWKETNDRVLFGTTLAEADDTGDLTITDADIQANRLYGDVTGNVTGDLTGDVTGSLSGGTVTSLSSPIALSEGGTGGGSADEARTSLGVDAAGTDNSTNVTLAGSLDYITLSGQQITRNAIDLTTDVTGVLPSANLDADTAHLSGTQTFSGAKTFSSTITGSITGNAGTATKWANPIEVSLTGDITGVTGASGLDGSADVSIATTIANNSVALGTQTTGNYMENVSAGTGISVSHTPSEGSTATISTNDSAIVHNNLNGYVANEHIDWTIDQGATNIDAGNYTDTNQLTTFVIQDGDINNVTISQGKYVKFQALTNGGLDIDWASSLGAGSSGDPYDLQFKIDLSNMGALVDTLESGDNLLVYNADEGTALAPVSEIQSALNIPSASGTTDGVVTLNANGTLTGESGLTYDTSTLAVTGDQTLSGVLKHSSNGSNRLTLDDDSDSSVTNQVTLAGVNNVNILIDGSNNGTGDFQIRSRPTTANDLDTADIIVDIDETTAIFDNITSQQFKIGGALRTRVLESGLKVENGSLGVGQNPPSVNGSAHISNLLRVGTAGEVALTVNDGGGNANVTFNHTSKVPDRDGNSGRIEVNVDSSGGEYMAFELAGNVTSGVSVATTEIARINSTGLQSSLSGTAASPALRVNDSDTGLYRIADNKLGISTAGTFAVAVDASQNVGIGTSTPSEKLDIRDGELVFTHSSLNQASSGTIRFNEYNGDNVAGSYMRYNGSSNSFHMYLNNESTDYEFLRATRNSHLVLQSGGNNVGIGETNPLQKLHISGNTMISNGSYYMAEDADGDDINLLGIHANNNVYIGASNNAYAGGFMLYGAASNTSGHVWYSGNAEAMRIDSSQRVGIGVVSPGYKLDVSGDARILSGSLGVGVAPNATDGRGDFSNDVVAYSTSDKRLKENIKPLDSALDKVLKINGVSFDWKELTEEEKKTIHGNEGHDVGVIAQEIEEVLPEVVTTRDSGYKAVKYEKIVPLLIEAIKEQQKQIEELKNG